MFGRRKQQQWVCKTCKALLSSPSKEVKWYYYLLNSGDYEILTYCHTCIPKYDVKVGIGNYFRFYRLHQVEEDGSVYYSATPSS